MEHLKIFEMPSAGYLDFPVCVRGLRCTFFVRALFLRVAAGLASETSLTVVRPDRAVTDPIRHALCSRPASALGCGRSRMCAQARYPGPPANRWSGAFIAWLAAFGVRELCSTFNRPETMTAVVRRRRSLGAESVFVEPRLLGSAGGPRLALL